MKEMYVKECPDWSFPCEYESEHRFTLCDFVRADTRIGKFFRKNAILLIFLAGMIVWTWAIGTICYHNGKVDTEARLAAEYEQMVAEAVQATKDEIAASKFLSGDASKQAQMERDARLISQAMDGIKTITERDDDLRTYAWSVLFRVADSGYPNSVAEVVAQPNQYMGFSDTNPVVTAKYRIAYEAVEAFYAGNWPVDGKFIYAEWDNKGKVILRDTYLAGRDTEYWYWGK